jgi:hypothetical protein
MQNRRAFRYTYARGGTKKALRLEWFEVGMEEFTHQLISDEMFPLLFFSFGCDHGPISLEYTLHLGFPFVGSFKQV